MNARCTKLPAKTVRCAIYTRKSTEEGLQQDFNTLDAQRESAESFIAAQKHEGWVCLPEHYDDGGFTGGNLDRPAVTRLLADIKAGRIDCVVVYKVDRLSRSLLDFARMMETFEKFSSIPREGGSGKLSYWASYCRVKCPGTAVAGSVGRFRAPVAATGCGVQRRVACGPVIPSTLT